MALLGNIVSCFCYWFIKFIYFHRSSLHSVNYLPMDEQKALISVSSFTCLFVFPKFRIFMPRKSHMHYRRLDKDIYVISFK